MAQQALPILPQLIVSLWPHLALLGSFAAFVAWNGGVVLGKLLVLPLILLLTIF